MDLSDTTEVLSFRFSSYLNRSLLRSLWRVPSGKQNVITCSQQILFSLVDPLPSPPSLHSRQRYRIHRTRRQVKMAKYRFIYPRCMCVRTHEDILILSGHKLKWRPLRIVYVN